MNASVLFFFVYEKCLIHSQVFTWCIDTKYIFIFNLYIVEKIVDEVV